jgi:hypothetical protein
MPAAAENPALGALPPFAVPALAAPPLPAATVEPPLAGSPAPAGEKSEEVAELLEHAAKTATLPSAMNPRRFERMVLSGTGGALRPEPLSVHAGWMPFEFASVLEAALFPA